LLYNWMSFMSHWRPKYFGRDSMLFSWNLTIGETRSFLKYVVFKTFSFIIRSLEPSPSESSASVHRSQVAAVRRWAQNEARHPLMGICIVVADKTTVRWKDFPILYTRCFWNFNHELLASCRTRKKYLKNSKMTFILSYNFF
jgi:hypothetical protein